MLLGSPARDRCRRHLRSPSHLAIGIVVQAPERRPERLGGGAHLPDRVHRLVQSPHGREQLPDGERLLAAERTCKGWCRGPFSSAVRSLRFMLATASARPLTTSSRISVLDVGEEGCVDPEDDEQAGAGPSGWALPCSQ